VFDSLFEALFKYPPWVFEHGQIRFGGTAAGLAIAATAIVCAAAALWTYRTARRASPLDRTVLIGLRTLALLVLFLVLARPVLSVRAAVPQQNVIGVLLDDSRSMRVADTDGRARSSIIQREFGSPESGLLRALSDRYLVRLFKFASSAERVPTATGLEFAGTQTRLSDALRGARDELAGLPLAGLVVFSDGADTTSGGLDETLLELQAAALPVFTVGLGRDPIAQDIQIGRVTTPRTALKGTALVVDVPIDQRGYAGTSLPIDVESDGRILATRKVTLPRDGEPATVRLRFTVADEGPQLVRFRVPAQPGEAIAENNVRDVLIQVDDRREKILYVEGEPRFEVKFTRMAVDPDENLQLVVLQRTAENKYLRLHVDNASELAGGFPRSREELFAYRALILGSIDATAFTVDQLRMIAEFVDRRGGGLLMLGGRHAFAEGGYAGTPVADALPVLLDAAGRRDATTPVPVEVARTRAGASHPITQLGEDEEASATQWSQLPTLTSVNVLGAAKPGATVLLTGSSTGRGMQPVLAYHRYGRGKAAVLAVEDSWMWQLHADIAPEDMTHETFWRQLVRWLVADVPDPVMVTPSTDRLERGDPATLVVQVTDSSFMPVNTAQIALHMTSPTGRTSELTAQWTGERDGEYRATVVPDEDGMYQVRAEAKTGETSLGSGHGTFRVAPDDAEAFDAALREPLLRRLAEDTGGRYYTDATMARLPEDLQYTERGVTVVEERDLWDMPALFLALVGCVLGEWFYRRVRGLA
jgi:uncharacterized membrane protein